MQDVFSFLFGRTVASQMKAMEVGLRAIEANHQAYFTSIRSRYAVAGEEKPATLDEFVQPWWVKSQLTLSIEPTLREDIAAECLACAHAVAVLPPAATPTQKFIGHLRASLKHRLTYTADLRQHIVRACKSLLNPYS